MAGRVGINIGAFEGQTAFRNWIKGANITSGATHDPSKMDADGYPISSLAAALSMSTAVPVSFQDSGTQWVLKSTGTRSVVVNTGTRQVNVVSSSGGTVTGGTNSAMTVSGSNWRVVFTWSSATNPVVLNFASGSGHASGTGDLILCRASDEVAHDAGDIFNPEFVALYSAYNPAYIRTMGLNFAGSKNVCTSAAWANRITTSRISYRSAYFLPAIFAGTSTGTDQYTVAAAPTTNLAGWDANEMIQARITNASNSAITISNTANNGGKVQLTVNSSAALSPGQSVYVGRLDGTKEANGRQTILTVDDATHVTLTVNYATAYVAPGVTPLVGTSTLTVTGKTDGTKPIINMHGAPINWNESSAISANTNCTFIYDNVLDALVYNVSDGGIVSGWPIETQVALANKLNCGLWVNIPPLATVSDAQSLAALISGSLNSGQKAYFEHGNEVWNFQFSHTNWMLMRGEKLGFTNTYHSYYSCAGKMLMDGVTTGWGARTRAELGRVLGQQHTSPAQSARMNGSECVTGNANYNTFTTSRSFNASPNRFVDVCDVYAPAPYVDGANLRSGVVGGWASREAAALQAIADAWNLGTTAGQNSAMALIDNDIRKGTTNNQTVTIASNTFTGSSAYTNGWRVLMANVNGLSSTTPYFVVNASGNTFKVSATSGGSAITGLSSAGTMTSGRLGGGVVLTLLNQLEYYAAHEAIVAGYDSQRAGISLSPLTVECYEGFLEHIYVSGVTGSITSANCDSIGLTPSGGGAGSAWLALTSAYVAYLASNYAQQMAYDFCDQFSAYSHFRTPGFLILTGPSFWALSAGDITATTYKTYDGARLYSNRKRRFIIRS